MGFWYLYVYSGDWDSSLTLQCDILYASSITFVYMRTGAQGARHRTLKMQYDPEAIVTHYAGTAGKDADSFDPSGKYTIKKQGAFAAVEATVSHGDEVMSDSGAMVSMSNNIDLAVSMPASPTPDVPFFANTADISAFHQSHFQQYLMK